MKLKICISIIGLFYIISCTEQKKIIPQRELLLLKISSISKSGLKSITEYKYSGGKVEEIMNYTEYKLNADLRTSAIVQKYIYLNDRVESQKIYSDKKELLNTISYEYNSLNQVITTFEQPSNLLTKRITRKYQYDSGGNIAIEEYYKYDNLEKNVYKFKYEFLGNNTVKKSYYDSQDILFGELVYLYDGKINPLPVINFPKVKFGNILSIAGTENYRPFNGTINFTPQNSANPAFWMNLQNTNYEYNELGYPIKSKNVFLNDGETVESIYEYLD